MRRKAPHKLDLGSLSLPERSTGIDYGLHPSQLAAVETHYRAVLLKHIQAWVRHAGTWPVKRWHSVFTAGLTGMLTLTCWPTGNVSCLGCAGTGYGALHQAYRKAVPSRSRSFQAASVPRSLSPPKCCAGTAACMDPPCLASAVMLQHSDLVAHHDGSCCTAIS